MDINQKAQAYDEAIKKLHKMIAIDNHPVLLKEIGESLFPGFNESEDEKIRKELISFIESVQHNYLCATDRREKWIAYLKKQKEQKVDCLHPEDYPMTPEECIKLAEWSEKDEKIVSGIYAVLEAWDRSHTAPGGIPSLIPEYCLWLENRLKSLRSRPKSSDNWKPSEEQMEALETAKRWYSDNMGCNLSLELLYEQLKKLM